MELMDVITKRQSVREYLDKPVPEDKLQRILESARLAPSGGNRQQWKYIVVKDPEKRQKLMGAANNQPMIAQAPVIIAAVALDPVRMMMCDIPSYAVDLGIAIEHMVLTAVNEGLGTCWVGAFSQEKAREILGVPSNYKVVTVLPVGYPKQTRAASTRKSFNEVVCYETFKE